MRPVRPTIHPAQRVLLAIATGILLAACTVPTKAGGNAQGSPPPATDETDEATDSALTGTVLPQIKF
ncbi:hypothetical protein J7643_02775 [bacterium]|nr:hypothetical protein [bacterium]